jgi:purine nucleoside phosphorylase
VPYSLPHLINRRAIVTALRQEGVTKVVGFGSVGGLKAEYGPGTVTVCDDFFQLWTATCLNDDASAHIGTAQRGRHAARHTRADTWMHGHTVPSYNEPLREEIMAILTHHDIAFKRQGPQAPRCHSRARAPLTAAGICTHRHVRADERPALRD